METVDRKDLSTEKHNLNSLDFDNKSISEILHIINQEDRTIADKVAGAIDAISQTVELTTNAIRSGNKIYYIGAGTSGRLGVLDASEMPPTFSVPSDWFNGIIAGGDEALRNSIEGAEDKPEMAIKDLKEYSLESGDVLIGISTSGAAKYVQSAINYAKSINAEVITGSTRMKAGTATKMVLNMISTTTMVQLGKVYGNLMVDLMTVNDKLKDRGVRIIKEVTGVSDDVAESKLFEAGNSVKTAMVMIQKSSSKDDALIMLEQADGILRRVLK